MTNTHSPIEFSPEGFAKLYNVSRETIDALNIYAQTLEKWQQRINLISSKTLDEIWKRHIFDSAQLYFIWRELYPDFDEAFEWVDLGSGAGFPGMVVSILMQDEFSYEKGQVHLVESTAKKTSFLREVKRLTKNGAQIHNCRIEQIDFLTSDIDHRFFSARALSDLDKLLAYIHPHFTPRSEALFLKGDKVTSEITLAQQNWIFDFKTYKSLTDDSGIILKISSIEQKA